MEKLKSIWLNGEIIPWDKAQVHVMTHSLHYGYAAFEGIRCYAQTGGGAAIYRLNDHLDRLFDTAHILQLEIPYQSEALVKACCQLVRDNDLLDGCYLRPLVYMGEGEMGIAAIDNRIEVGIMAWRWGAYLGEEGQSKGIRTMVSSYRRSRSDSLPAKGKITGQYVGSILAKREAMRNGFQEAILLDAQGYAAEGTGENLFMVKDGRVRTPGIGQAILAGITRDTAIRLLKDDGITVEESQISRDELYCADEIFLTGTAAEITPVRELDHRTIGAGSCGDITAKLQATFRKETRGELPRSRELLTPV